MEEYNMTIRQAQDTKNVNFAIFYLLKNANLSLYFAKNHI